MALVEVEEVNISEPEEEWEDVMEILRRSPEKLENTIDLFPASLNNYALPIIDPLREDPPCILNWPQRIIPNKKDQRQKDKIKEYKMLIESNQRSGHVLQEAYAHLSLGIVYDNLEDIKKASGHYLLFMEIMLSLQHTEFISVGFNVLGVNYYLMGPQWFKHSAYCHARHAHMADEEGKFLAGVNMGILYLNSNLIEKAEVAFSTGLRYAVQTQSNQAQAIAIAFQGLVKASKEDYLSAAACMERYAQLSQKRNDLAGQAKALLNLGHTNQKLENYVASENYYEKTVELVEFYGDTELGNQAKISLALLKTLIKQQVLLQQEQLKQEQEEKLKPPQTQQDKLTKLTSQFTELDIMEFSLEPSASDKALMQDDYMLQLNNG